MRVMLDTNILVSAIFFPSERTRSFLRILLQGNTIVLSEYTIQELKQVVSEKFPHLELQMARFLRDLPFVLLPYEEKECDGGLPAIRDVKDVPVLAAAILEKADVLITGDKDFLVLQLEHPEIMTMTEFTQKYAK